MDNVIQFPGETILAEAPEVVLERAKGWGLTTCVIVGFDEKGDLAFGGSTSDIGQIVLLLEIAKHRMVCEADPA